MCKTNLRRLNGKEKKIGWLETSGLKEIHDGEFLVFSFCFIHSKLKREDDNQII